MALSLSVVTRGLESIANLANTLRGNGWMVEAANEAARDLEHDLQTYPGVRRKKQPFKTDKQRRFFFAALADGRIRVTYQRTNRLGKGWRADVVMTKNGLTVTVGNTTAYAPYVQGSQQAGYHRGNWKRVDELSQGVEQRVVVIFNRRIDQVIKNGEASATYDDRAGVLRDTATGRFTSAAQATGR
jgi:hypothetical protein